ncbi:cytochrome P450 [Biscogniauxia marginata]|nr:cytochrome P450 [Biscogniauxia marginata]
MIYTLLVFLGAIVVLTLYVTVSGLYRNIALAKASGLPYYIAPVNPKNAIVQLTTPIWARLWRLLPKRYWEHVIDVCIPDWQYQKLHEPFEKLGETFLLATPTLLIIFTDDAELIHQITSRREAFPKPLESYKILTLFGENVVTTEGSLWRMHRKITAASFNERNSALVFRVAVEQAQGMVDYWMRRGTTDKITSLEDDTMTLALNIISFVGFGLRLLWPGQTVPADTDPRLVKYTSLGVPTGHSISFRDSIAGTLKYLLVLLVTPGLILNHLPFEILKLAKQARDSFSQYMEEFLKDKAEDVRAGDKETGMDIMGSLVATSYQNREAKAKGIELKDSEIIGNAFIMFLAGHETTANVIHFTLLELANNPAAQRQLQKDIDAIFGDADPGTWDYEEKINAMMASMIGAAMNETLRLMPPVTEVPKKVSPAQDQVVTVNGAQHALPRGAYIGMVVPAVQRNPRFWPAKPSGVTTTTTTTTTADADADADKPHDLDDWAPERWFRPSSSSSSSSSTSPNETVSAQTEDADADVDDFGGYAGPDTSAQLYRPARGSYIPFSGGARSCLGRRIAQVEILAALAVVLRGHSVENAVDDWADDARVAAMGLAEREDLYARAADRSRRTLRAASSLVTLKLHGDAHVPVRLVRRGEERFVSWLGA